MNKKATLLRISLFTLMVASPAFLRAQVPVGEGAVPVGEGAVPVGEGAVPVGEEAVPVGEHAVPVGEGAVSVGEGAHLTNLDDARFSALQKAMNHPATAPLYKGELEARYAGLKKRAMVAIQSPDPSAGEAAAQAAHDRKWGDAARVTARSEVATLFDASWWQTNKKKFSGASRFYFSQKEPAAWRKGSKWDTLAGALKLKKPFYFDYGRNITFNTDVISINGQQVAGHRDIVGSARRLSGMPPAADGAIIHWSPLGTFLLSQNPNGEKVEIALQMVCGDDGTISGSYYDWNTKHSEAIVGKVDLETQRVAFNIRTSRIVMEVGLANLTRNEARIWAHLPDGRSPVWLLVRVGN